MDKTLLREIQRSSGFWLHSYLERTGVLCFSQMGNKYKCKNRLESFCCYLYMFFQRTLFCSLVLMYKHVQMQGSEYKLPTLKTSFITKRIKFKHYFLTYFVNQGQNFLLMVWYYLFLWFIILFKNNKMEVFVN